MSLPTPQAYDRMVPIRDKLNHEWTAAMYRSSGQWFFVKETDGLCPKCGREGVPVEAISQSKNVKKPLPDGTKPGDAPPPPRPNLSTPMAIVAGVKALVTRESTKDFSIPYGMKCTACKRTEKHAEDCRPPRGLKVAEARA